MLYIILFYYPVVGIVFAGTALLLWLLIIYAFTPSPEHTPLLVGKYLPPSHKIFLAIYGNGLGGMGLGGGGEKKYLPTLICEVSLVMVSPPFCHSVCPKFFKITSQCFC